MNAGVLLCSTICIFVSIGIGDVSAIKQGKFELSAVPDSAWMQKEVISNSTDSAMQCAAMFTADFDDAYFLSYDEVSKTCETGVADVTQSGTGGRKVWAGPLGQIDKLGILNGNADGDRPFDIVMPNGKICPASDHGIPDFDRDEGGRRNHGIAELDGVVYLVGGKIMGNTVNQTATCYKLDLHSSSSNRTWQPIAPLPNDGTPTMMGLTPYANSEGNKFLYLINADMCYTSGTAQGHVRQYDVAANNWTDVGRTLSREYFGNPVAKGRYIYMLGGRTCNNTLVKDIWRFDMENPNQDAVLLEHQTCILEGQNMACSLYTMEDQEGILCAGGADPTIQHNVVQFIPLNDNGTTKGACQQLDAMPGIKASGYLFNFGQGQLVLYGGFDYNAADNESRATYTWDEAAKSFTDAAMLTANRDVRNPAGNYIDAKLVLGGCWKHLV